jgi:hypothetical protein
MKVLVLGGRAQGRVTHPITHAPAAAARDLGWAAVLEA